MDTPMVEVRGVEPPKISLIRVEHQHIKIYCVQFRVQLLVHQLPKPMQHRTHLLPGNRLGEH